MTGSLRDALEKLAEEWRWQGDMRPWQEGGGPDAYEGGLDDAAAKLRAVLAAIPAEPTAVTAGDYEEFGVRYTSGPRKGSTPRRYRTLAEAVEHVTKGSEEMVVLHRTVTKWTEVDL